MTNQQLFIPDRINVGFKEKEGTYTGILAYVVYWDDKNVLRKEKSLNSWRDKNIALKQFDNEPTDGFVLNKKVGGYKSDWNFRKTYIRVYDPRDFEFEISVENLLFILENCSSIKGKGLEGKFVYSWSGTDLVLLPVDCEDYKKCIKYTELQNKKVSKKDLKIGNVYLDKKQRELLYIGRHDKFIYELGYKYFQKISKEHVFKELHNGFYEKSKNVIFRGFEFNNNVNELMSENHNQIAEAIQDYYESAAGSKIIDVITKPIEPKLIKTYYSKKFKIYKTHWVFDDGFYKCISYWFKDNPNKTSYNINKKYLIDSLCNIKSIECENSFTDYDLKNVEEIRRIWQSNGDEKKLIVSCDHFEHYRPIEVLLKLESGTLIKFEDYLGIDYYFKQHDNYNKEEENGEEYE